jgi:phosphoglycerate dehydrogenase-like enzyme
MTRIAVLDDWQKVARSSAEWSALEARAELVFFDRPFAHEDDAAATLADFDVILAMRERTPFPASLARRLPKLRMFNMTGPRAGLIDTAALAAQDVTVCYTEGGDQGEATAELALGLMLGAARDIPGGDAAIRAGRFQEGVRVGIQLAGKTLGLVGLGRLGTRMAGYGRALGMEVIAWSPNLTPERAAARGAALVSKEELLSRADVVSLHIVLSQRTHGIIGAGDIARMKPGAILVNTSRAPLIKGAALLEAVQAGRIIAALDVFDREPPAVDDPLRRAPNTTLTPHLGYGSREVFQRFHAMSIENVLAWLDGKPIRVMPGAKP